MSTAKISSARLLRATLACAVAVAACAHDETVDRRACEKLRSHIVDVRVSAAFDPQDADAAQHRAAMEAALGDAFLEKCERSMSLDELHCAMRADDLGAASACAHSAMASK